MSAPIVNMVPDDAQSNGNAAGVAQPGQPLLNPLRKLTSNLLKTYRNINERYYQAKKERQRNEKKDADYQVSVGDVLGGKYRVKSSLGKGSFGQVVSAEDINTGVKVAVKVIKNREAFRRQAKTEIKLLELLNARDPQDQWCIVRFLEHFEHNGHVCLVFEHLAFNLYELLRRTHFRGVALSLIRKFARQILTALAYLSLPEIDVIHCDLKPENILFRVPHRSALKVIDYGSSCQRDQQQYKYIQSRFYRSPEVIMELGYTQAIDMWSLGCILVELHTGMPLFSGKDEADQIRRFIALKGLPPHHMLAASRKTEKYFDVVYPAGVPVPKDGQAMEVEGSGSHPMDESTGAGAMPADTTGHDTEEEGDEWYDSSDYEEEEGEMSEHPVMGGPLGAYAIAHASADHPMEGTGGLEERPKRGARKGSRGNTADMAASGSGSSGAGAAGVLLSPSAGVGAAPMGAGGRRVRRKDSEAASVGSHLGKASTASVGSRGGSRRGRGRPITHRSSARIPVAVPPPGPVYTLKPALAAGYNARAEAAEPAEGEQAKPLKPEPPVYTDLREVLGVHTGGPGGRHKHRPSNTGAPAGSTGGGTGSSVESYLQFLDLVERMLDYDPATRVKPMEALAHPFLRADLEEATREKAAAASAAATAAAQGQGQGQSMHGQSSPAGPQPMHDGSGMLGVHHMGGGGLMHPSMGGGGQVPVGMGGLPLPLGAHVGAHVMGMGMGGLQSGASAALALAMGSPHGAQAQAMALAGLPTMTMGGMSGLYGMPQQGGQGPIQGQWAGMPLHTGLISTGPGSGRHSHRGSFQGIAPGPHGPGQGTPLGSPGGTLQTGHSNTTSAQSSPRQGAHAPVHSFSGGSSMS